MTTLTTSNFVPADLDGSKWENLQPLYQALVERELMCSGCLEALLLDRSELDAAASEAYANLYINMTCHTDDEQAKAAYLALVEDVLPQLKLVGFELDKKIVSCPHTKDLDQNRYEVMLRELECDVEIFHDENVPLQTQDKKLGQQFSELCGAMTVTFQGQEKTLPQVAKHLEETDRAVREEVWRLVADRRFKDHDKLNDIFDEMIKIRHRIAQNAGFDNYRDYMFKAKHRFDYTPADCEDFHKGAQEVCVPLFRKLNKQRVEALGVESLRPWDLAVDTKGREPLRPFENADQMVAGTSRIFHRMGSSLGEMFDTLRGGDCLDLDSRKGKAPGGYQQMRDRKREPFIFMNAAGMQGDLETMIHEAGHAFHSILSKQEPLLHYRHSPLEFAEVASMSMELMTHPYLDEFYTDKSQADRARRTHLEDLARLLPWIATIDAFQHWIYTNPEHSHDDRTAKWLELDARFGAAVNWDDLEKYKQVTWQRQLHLFEVPFYYIEYGIAQIGALQLWLQYKKDAVAALKNYQTALTIGGARPLPELFDAAGLEFDFGPQTMKRLMNEVQTELDTLPL